VVRFDSHRLASDLLVEVPHTGQVCWNSMARMPLMTSAAPSPGWLDSPAAMERGIERIRQLAPDHEWKTWECGILDDQSPSGAHWRIHATFKASSGRFRDAVVYLDPADGSEVHSVAEER